MAGPDPLALAWVAQVLQENDLQVVRGMRAGYSPWLLRAGDREVVLREGQPGELAPIMTEVRALQLAAEVGIPAPLVLAYDDGSAAQAPLILMERVPGSSMIPIEPEAARLAALGAMAARLHAVPLEPSADLPVRRQPIADVDFAQLRREQEPRELLERGEAVLAATGPTADRRVFVHGDLWGGNTLWAGGQLTALLDWDSAGTGDPGVDLGSLRLDAALCYGPEMAVYVLAGWEAETGQAATDVAYWDLVAALATPPDMGWFPETISAQGRPDLDQETVLTRRDLFLSQALDQLT
jgi:aminoglycoside phosphotransferase (APT) family kinase protein